MSDEDRLTLRRAESRPTLDLLHARLSTWKLQLLPKHPMCDAIGYALRPWEELDAFSKDCSAPIDNNLSERERKRTELNRKNSLFAGNESGYEIAALLAGLISTCRRHEIDPQRYLTQLITNLPDTPLSQLDHWLPDQRRAANPDSIPAGKV